VRGTVIDDPASYWAECSAWVLGMARSTPELAKPVPSHIEWPLGAHTPQIDTSAARFTSGVGRFCIGHTG